MFVAKKRKIRKPAPEDAPAGVVWWAHHKTGLNEEKHKEERL
jgi:hypothetical protein